MQHRIRTAIGSETHAPSAFLRTVAMLAVTALITAGCIPDGDSPAAGPSPADLSTMELSAGPLNPAFTPAVTNYDVMAPHGTDSTMLTATAANASAKLAVNNQPAVSGQPFGPIPLDVGINPVTVVVDAPGATKSYTVVVTRGGPADLFGLELSAGPLSPDFDPATTDYSVSAPSTTTQTTVTATLSDERATFTINGQPATSGQPSNPINLATGTNTITIVVTAVNGTTKTYRVFVNRAGPGNANLSTLQLSAGPLSPPFNPNTVNYSVTTASTTATTTVTATVQVASSSLTINGQPAVSGVPFGPIPLNPSGTTTQITITVRAQDGVTVKTYTVEVARGASSNANLSNLVVSAGALQPPFSPTRTSYDVETSKTTFSTTVTATAQDSSATVKINNGPANPGQSSAAVLLLSNTTRINIEVRAQNGNTRTYRVDVEKD
ncbi:hypothetical protein DNFV4_03940 [Nitrospira tepida]|uniref:Cadherin-like beta-sandwich-like domain-containing protein n=1 Tax=Nitrospira tepida TaxID=2973512 RepID=A0AA86N2B7_9BACT|nr:cadherin-like beta sandwich domain-containing protein [Nitrospira tepida]CAI4033503.1 hypothetical protein DNFV4_03940 [Nitrospira tepida]